MQALIVAEDTRHIPILASVAVTLVLAPQKPFLLRLSPVLLDELSHWAEDELRSLNGQIEYLLRDAVRTRESGYGTL